MKAHGDRQRIIRVTVRVSVRVGLPEPSTSKSLNTSSSSLLSWFMKSKGTMPSRHPTEIPKLLEANITRFTTFRFCCDGINFGARTPIFCSPFSTAPAQRRHYMLVTRINTQRVRAHDCACAEVLPPIPRPATSDSRLPRPAAASVEMPSVTPW